MMGEILMDLLVESPYFGYLAGKVHMEEKEAPGTMKTSFCDGPIITYSRPWFESLDYEMKKGAVIHELLHLALLHFARRDGRHELLWHMACDLAVSELMEKEHIHSDVLTVDKFYRELGIILPVKSSAEVYYERIQGEKDRFDLDTETGKVSFESGNIYRNGQLEEVAGDGLEIKSLVDELTLVQIAADAEDGMEKSLLEQTEAIYRPYKVNWRNVLKRFLAGQGRIHTRKSYKRQSRRYEDLPGSKRSVGVRALVAVDESGSVSDEEVAAFHKELIRINGINGADITAVRFDSACSEPMPLARFVSENKRERRGGTDFRPVFEMADRMKIPMVIVFTDGEGEAPTSVQQKVLWVLTSRGRLNVDYGIKVKFQEG